MLWETLKTGMCIEIAVELRSHKNSSINLWHVHRNNNNYWQLFIGKNCFYWPFMAAEAASFFASFSQDLLL